MCQAWAAVDEFLKRGVGNLGALRKVDRLKPRALPGYRPNTFILHRPTALDIEKLQIHTTCDNYCFSVPRKRKEEKRGRKSEIQTIRYRIQGIIRNVVALLQVQSAQVAASRGDYFGRRIQYLPRMGQGQGDNRWVQQLFQRHVVHLVLLYEQGQQLLYQFLREAPFGEFWHIFHISRTGTYTQINERLHGRYSLMFHRFLFFSRFDVFRSCSVQRSALVSYLSWRCKKTQKHLPFYRWVLNDHVFKLIY